MLKSYYDRSGYYEQNFAGSKPKIKDLFVNFLINTGVNIKASATIGIKLAPREDEIL